MTEFMTRKNSCTAVSLFSDYSGAEAQNRLIKIPLAFCEHKNPCKKNGSLWHNKLIWGDNLQALKILVKNPSVRGKIRLVYIDPPFSTKQTFRSGLNRISTISRSNSDMLAYEDKLSGTAYLGFLKGRFILLRDLLADDGSMYVHIDSKMGHYVKILLDEVFGHENFINEITRIKCNPKNFARNGYGNIKDTIFFYSKSRNYIWNDAREKFSKEDIARLFPKIDEKGRRYTTNPLHAPGETINGMTGRSWKGLTPPIGRHWRNSPRELELLDKKGLIEWSSTGNPRKIIYADEFIKRGKKRQDVWADFKDNAFPSYPTEKNLDMLKMIIQASSNENDIVLDCFAGSGSTLLAAEATGRRWIGIDSSQVAIAAMIKRLSSVHPKSEFAQYVLKNK